MESEKLQKIMAQAGLGSRRHNEEMISAGRVTVNGRVAKLGDRADVETNEILVDGELLHVQKLKYIMLNKPKGVLTSTEDELAEGRKTVRDLVNVEGHLYPVGRLDLQSEGLVLLTNDGDLAHRLTHPRYGHKKTYRAWVERQPSLETLQKWRSGVMLDDKKTLPCDVEILSRGSYVVELKIVLHEGRKRQIRRVASQLGHPVRRLVREQIGVIRLSDVQPGEWRYLTGQEIKMLKQSVKMVRESAEKPHKMGRNAVRKPYKMERDSGEKPRRMGRDSDEKPRRMGRDSDEKPRRMGRDSDEKPRRMGRDSDEKPRRMGRDSDEKPRKVGRDSDGKPRKIGESRRNRPQKRRQQ